MYDEIRFQQVQQNNNNNNQITTKVNHNYHEIFVTLGEGGGRERFIEIHQTQEH